MTFKEALAALLCRDVVTLDFETERIENRPHYPPVPVGVALKFNDQPSRYWAWGHPTGNNCRYEDVKPILEEIWASDYHVVMHHAKFDLAVALEKLGFPVLPWYRLHDTTFLHFLFDPHAKKAGLKEVAEELLDWPPEERDAVADWIWANRVQLVDQYGGKITRAKSGPNSAGAWLSKAPGDVVDPYARGDVDRTYALFQALLPYIV